MRQSTRVREPDGRRLGSIWFLVIWTQGCRSSGLGLRQAAPSCSTAASLPPPPLGSLNRGNRSKVRAAEAGAGVNAPNGEKLERMPAPLVRDCLGPVLLKRAASDVPTAEAPTQRARTLGATGNCGPSSW